MLSKGKTQSIILPFGFSLPSHIYWVSVAKNLAREAERLNRRFIRNNHQNSSQLALRERQKLDLPVWAHTHQSKSNMFDTPVSPNASWQTETRHFFLFFFFFFSYTLFNSWSPEGASWSNYHKSTAGHPQQASKAHHLSNQSGRQPARRVELWADTEPAHPPHPLLPWAKDGHARCSASAFLAFL